MEEALKALNSLTEKLDTIKAQFGDKADKVEIKAISEQIKSLTDSMAKMEAAKVGESVASITKQLTEIAEDLNKMKERTSSTSPSKSFGQMVVDKIKEAGITKLNKGENKTFEINANIVNKTVANMGTGNVSAVGTNAIPWELSSFEAGLTRIVTRKPWLLEIANTSPTSKMYVQWAEQANREGAANETAQGAAKNQIDFDWVEKSQKVEKITAFIKVSTEALSDLDGLANEIDMELREMILLKTDTDLLSGDGSTPTLKGLLEQDTAYSAGDFAATISNPNKADVLRTAISQVVTNLFTPNYILMHPTDVASMDLDKGTDGHYVLAPFKSANGMVISGVTILENTGQTVDKFTVGDFTKFNVKVRQGITIDIGRDADDFTKNLMTVLGEIRLASYVKANHVGAFVSGDFSDAIIALDSGS